MTQPTDWKQQARTTASANCRSFHDCLDLTDGVPELVSPVPIPEGFAQAPLLLTTLFGESARVCVATGRSNAKTQVVTAARITVKTRELPEGAWFKVNELIRDKPSGRNGGWADVDTATRYLLLEMDHAGQEEQWRFWSAAISVGFPVVSLVNSGNKSLHALIRVDAKDLKSYRTAADQVMALLSPFIPDPSTRNPSRYSRLPGVLRGPSKGEQKLEYLNPDAPVWSDSCEAASLLRDFAKRALPIPEKLRKALQHSREARERPLDADDNKDFSKKLGKLTGFRAIDLHHYAVDACWHQFSAEPVAGLEEKHYIHCPWAGEHTGSGDDDSATDAYLYERVTDARMKWGFHCSHHACQGRNVLDVLELAKEANPELFAECLAPEPDVLSGFDGVPDAGEPEGAEEWAVPEIMLTSAPNDVDNTHIFMKLHRAKVRHVRNPDKWLVWDDTRWKPDCTGQAAHLAKDVEKLRRKHAGDDPDAQKMAKGAGSAKAIANILTLASSEPVVAATADSFDVDPWLVGCVNGTLDLRTGTLRAARPGDMISMQLSCRYDPHAVCRRYDQFLEEIHPDDPNITAFIDLWSGYCLSGSAREDKMLIFHGPKGRNGKSTLVKVLSTVLGDYAAVMPEGFLAARKGGTDPSAPNAPMVALKGKRLALISETNERVMLDEAKVKMLTGGEMISVRRVFGTEQEQMSLSAKVIVSSNHRPEIKGTDPAIWSRILLVPFNETFADNPDRELFGKLMAEREGILARMVRGCLAYQEHGLAIPPSVVASTRDYRETEDVLQQFLNDCTEPDPSGHTDKAELHRVYRVWAERNGHSPIWTSVMLTRKMGEKGFRDRKSHGERVWLGFRCAENA